MASNNEKKPANKDVDPIVFLVCILAMFGMAYLFWQRFHTAIATVYSALRVVEFAPFLILISVWSLVVGVILLISGLTIFFKKKAYAKYGLWSAIAGIVCIVGYLVGKMFVSWFVFFKDSDKSLIEFGHMTKSSIFANLFTLVVCIIPFAVWIARRSLATNPTNHNNFGKTRDYTLHTYTDRMAQYYPHLALFRKLDLTSKPINSGKYRMSDTEKQFAIKHGLLDRVKVGDYKVNRDRATTHYMNQMTKLWTGYNNLSTWELAIFAVLVPRIAATDPEMSEKEYKNALKRTDDLLAIYWKSAAESYDVEKDTIKLDMTLAKVTLKKYSKSEKVKVFIKNHAYIGTILYAMLIEARTLGVLPPAELRWLRVVDRRLWLILNNTGKIVSWSEMGATYSHFLHELKQKRAIEKPMVDGAVRGLIEGVEGYEFSAVEVEEIERRLKDQETQEAINLKATAKDVKNLIVMALTAGTADQQNFYEVAVLNEIGEIVYEERCNPEVEMNQESLDRLGLLPAAREEVKKLRTATDVRDKLLEIVNGNNLITFDDCVIKLIPGVERSAAVITRCAEDEKYNLSATATSMGMTFEEALVSRKASEAARVCRLIWVEKQKVILQAQAEKPKASS